MSLKIGAVIALLGLFYSGLALNLGTALAQVRVTAPSLAGGRGWLNVARPLMTDDLKGRVILLDFWTQGCINCLHVIPELKSLEEHFGNKLTVIGVHSAKFESEKDLDHIRQAVLKNGLTHPVVNDSEFQIWEAFTVKAWPTLVLIDAKGKIALTLSGEGHAAELRASIESLVAEAGSNLNTSKLPLALERDKAAANFLSFPGKILGDPKSQRLFVSDSGNNRVLILKPTGTVELIIGSGNRGAKDGSFSSAQFRGPQGLALKGDILYIADTQNHLIRAANLRTQMVTTVAGTGQQLFDPGGGQAPRKQGLNSPWDLAVVDDQLYIAMAGSHQIWKYNLKTLKLAPFAGSGREALTDGTGPTASFAQPSGLAIDGNLLFIADSEASAIRALDLTNGKVVTLIGKGLFDFGDIDGPLQKAKLQHPLGLALESPGKLLIADSYNQKIKRLDTKTGRIETVASPPLQEPGGLTILGDETFVASTNSSKIIRLKAGSELPISNPGTATASIESISVPKHVDSLIRLPSVAMHPGGRLTAHLNLTFGSNLHLNPLAPSRIIVSSETKGLESFVIDEPIQDITFTVPSPLPPKLWFTVRAFYCDMGDTGLCYTRTVRFEQTGLVESAAAAGPPLALNAHFERSN